MSVLNQAPAHEPGWNAFAASAKEDRPGVNYGDMLKQARAFTRLGEGSSVKKGQHVINGGTSDNSTPNSAAGSVTNGTALAPGKIGVGSIGTASTVAGTDGGPSTVGSTGETGTGPDGNVNEDGDGIIDFDALDAFTSFEGILAN